MYKILIISFVLLFFETKAQSFYKVNFGAAFTKVNPFSSPLFENEFGINITNKHGLGARFGIDYEKQFASKWAFQSGLRLTWFTDKKYYENLRWPEEFVNGIYTFNPNLIHEGAASTRDYFLEVPFLLKYTIKSANKWTHFIDFGLGVNIQMLTGLKSITGIKQNTTFSRGQIVPSALLGFGLEYKYNENFSFIFKPNITHTRFAINSKLLRGSTSYFYYGIDLGLKYPF